MDRPLFMCNSCCLLWNREEMNFDTEYECDLCDECMAHPECDKCEGTGHDIFMENDGIICPKCNGTGE